MYQNRTSEQQHNHTQINQWMQTRISCSDLFISPNGQWSACFLLSARQRHYVVACDKWALLVKVWEWKVDNKLASLNTNFPSKEAVLSTKYVVSICQKKMISSLFFFYICIISIAFVHLGIDSVWLWHTMQNVHVFRNLDYELLNQSYLEKAGRHLSKSFGV